MNKQYRLCLVAILASTSVNAETIRFNKGDILHVKLIKQTKSTLTFFHRILGEETIRKEAISNLSDIDLRGLTLLPESEADIAAEKNLKVTKEKQNVAENSAILAKEKKQNDGFLGTGWFKDWESNLEIGLLGAAGSSINTTFRTAFNTGYEDKEGSWSFKSFYYYSSENKVTSNNKIYAVLVKDWFFSDTQWFAFTSSTYGMDSFKDWRHRLQISAGPGYQFVKTEHWEFSARISGTGVFEFDRNVDGVAAPNKSSFEAVVGADLIWNITEKQRVTVSNYFYTNLTDTGAFRNLSNLAWLHDIEWFEGLAIKFGIRNEYDTTQPIPDEFKYNFSLVWGF